MKINWVVRIKNPLFWLMIAFAIASPIGTYFNMSGSDITSWAILIDVLSKAADNPFLLFNIAWGLVIAIIDPTTRGFKDSGLSMTYSKPKDDAAIRKINTKE